MRLRVLAVVFTLTGSLFAADPGLLNLAMPDGQVMAGVNFEQFMLSPYGQYLASQTAQLNAAGLPKLIETSGFDPRRDLKEILVSAKLLPKADEAVILARGTFDVPKILEAARSSGATVDSYKGVSYVETSRQAAMAFPDSTIVISGNPASVQAAVDRITAPTSIPSALAVQVNQLSTTEDAWFVDTIPLSQLKPQGPQQPAAQKVFALLGQIQQASGGVKFGANVVVDLQAMLPTAQEATGMAAVMKSFAGAAEAFKSGQFAPAALLKDLNVTADGTVVKISLSIPEQQIEQLMQMQKSQAGQAQGIAPPEPKKYESPESRNPARAAHPHRERRAEGQTGAARRSCLSTAGCSGADIRRSDIERHNRQGRHNQEIDPCKRASSAGAVRHGRREAVGL